MKRFPSRLFFASLTFVIGISFTAFWIVVRYPNSNFLSQNEIVYDNSIEVGEPEIQKETAIPVNNYEPSDVLMIISDTGGLVPDSNSISKGRIGHSELVITRDGRYSTKGDVIVKNEGNLQKAKLDELEEEIDNADFDDLKSEKFNGLCQSSVDGRDRTFIFYTQTSIEQIDNCQTVIRLNSRLFVKVFEILELVNRNNSK